ncbi:MAG: hypothetical protein AB7Q97_11795 [Gammaproteobacteria bacterium]
MSIRDDHRIRRTRAACAILGAALAADAGAAGLLDSLRNLATPAEYVVRGRLQTRDGQWLTCFDGIQAGYLGRSDMARPGDARVEPATGRMQLSTAAIPAVVMTREGVVAPNDCDALASRQLLVLAPPPATGLPAGDGLIRDKYGCGTWTDAEFRAADKDAIMACQARVLTEREWARQQAGQAAGSPGSAAPPDAARQATLEQLQADTAAKFAAIQAGAGAPAAPASAAPAAEDLAWDGAKLCGLKPAYMMKLRDEALAFVRLDGAADRIVMSEFAGGERREIALDANTFAQRASFNASAIGQGGDNCGRAFWNAEAFKAASAAMTAR